MQITSAAMRRFAKQIGDYAEIKVAELNEQGCAQRRRNGRRGIYRVAALGDNGALGAGATALTNPGLADEISKLDVLTDLKKALVPAASYTAGAAIG